jgi:hypothetical protein
MPVPSCSRNSFHIKFRSVPDIEGNGLDDCFVGLPAMNPSTECRKLAALLCEQAKALQDAEIRAEYAYLIRGFLRLARQFEHDRETKPLARSPKRSIFTSKSS